MDVSIIADDIISQLELQQGPFADRPLAVTTVEDVLANIEAEHKQEIEILENDLTEDDEDV